MVGMANGSEIAVETVVEAARSVEVDGGGACDEGDREAVGETPDITDTVNLQLIQPRTPSQFLQVVRLRTKAATTTTQHQAALRLQEAARDFLARQRLQKAHKQMRDREAALAAVAFAFDAVGCDLDSLDSYQQLCRSAAMSKGVHGVFPADGVLQLCGEGGRGGVFLLVTSGDALPSASAFRLRPPRGRLRWSSSRLLPGGCAPAPLSFRWSLWDPGGRTHATSSCGWCLPSGSHTIKKSESD
jgi:hypothetical protein